MTAVQDFLQSEWKENECAIAKQKSIRDLRAALELTLRGVSDATERMKITPRAMPQLGGDGCYRILVGIGCCIVCFWPWYFIWMTPIWLVNGRWGYGPGIVIGLPISICALVTAWWTPEIVFSISERFRINSVRSQMQATHDRLSTQAEELQRQIKAIEAEK